jgi:hypothetical protein
MAFHQCERCPVRVNYFGQPSSRLREQALAAVHKAKLLGAVLAGNKLCQGSQSGSIAARENDRPHLLMFQDNSFLML